MAKRQKYILDDGREMIFSAKKLNKGFKMYESKSKKQDVKISKENIRQEIADKCCVSESAIKHWLLGHNAPGDYEKVKDLANALGVSAEDLLENENESSEERNIMNNIINENKMDYSTTKSIVRDIYEKMVDYIEAYRMARRVDSETNPIIFKPLFENLYVSIKKAKMDLPKELFNELRDFSINYLQLMGCLIAFEDALWDGHYFDESYFENADDYWDAFIPVSDPCEMPYYYDVLYVETDYLMENKYGKLFEEVFKKDHNFYEDGMEEMVKEFIISDKAYAIIDEILKDYIPD